MERLNLTPEQISSLGDPADGERWTQAAAKLREEALPLEPISPLPG
jgi:hypothetical protein